jgi:hypothetical protein
LAYFVLRIPAKFTLGALLSYPFSDRVISRQLGEVRARRERARARAPSLLSVSGASLPATPELAHLLLKPLHALSQPLEALVDPLPVSHLVFVAAAAGASRI